MCFRFHASEAALSKHVVEAHCGPGSVVACGGTALEAAVAAADALEELSCCYALSAGAAEARGQSPPPVPPQLLGKDWPEPYPDPRERYTASGSQQPGILDTCACHG